MKERKRRSKEINREIDKIDTGGELKLGPFVEDENEKERIKRHRLQKRKKMMTIILEVAGGIIFAALILFLIMRIRTVNFNGLTLDTPENMQELIGVENGKSYFGIKKKEIKSLIEKDPHYIVESIEYRFPSTLDINLHERYNEACFSNGDKYTYMNRDGIAMESLDKSEGAMAPIVEGITFSQFYYGAVVETVEETKFDSLKMLLNELVKTKTFPSVKRINYTDPEKINMELEAGTAVLLGSSEDMEEKISWLDSIVETLKKEGLGKGTINLISPTMPVYVPDETEQNNSDTDMVQGQPEENDNSETSDGISGDAGEKEG